MVYLGVMFSMMRLSNMVLLSVVFVNSMVRRSNMVFVMMDIAMKFIFQVLFGGMYFVQMGATKCDTQQQTEHHESSQPSHRADSDCAS